MQLGKYVEYILHILIIRSIIKLAIFVYFAEVIVIPLYLISGGEVVTPRPNPPTDRPNPPTDRPRPTYTPRPDPTPDPVPTPTPVPESCNPQFDAMASARALNRRALTYGFSGKGQMEMYNYIL